MKYNELNDLVDRYTATMNEVYRRISNIMTEKVHQELTTDQFSTLNYIYKNEPCTSSDIAHEFSIGKSAVTAQINRLYERGLLSRERDQNDRRNVYLHLTEIGKELMQEGTQKLYDVLGEILSEFNQDEIQTFILTLEKLAHTLKQR